MSTHNYLIYSGPGIGDITMILPMAKTLKTRIADLKIDLFIRSNKNKVKVVKELIEYQDFINDVYYYNPRELYGFIKMVMKLKSNKYEYVFLCKHLTEDEPGMPLLISNLTGAKTVGPTNYHSKLKYDFPVIITEKKHICETFCDLLKVVELPTNVNNDVFDVDRLNTIKLPKAIESMHYIVFCIGTGMVGYKKNGKHYYLSGKQWSKSNWEKLIDKITDSGLYVVAIGEYLEHESISGKFANLTSATEIKESLRIIQCSELVVGADTGMMHCAAALGKNTIALFGMTDPVEYAPYGEKNDTIDKGLMCEHCFGKEESIHCLDNKCMSSITVQDVFFAIQKSVGNKLKNQ